MHLATFLCESWLKETELKELGTYIPETTTKYTSIGYCVDKDPNTWQRSGGLLWLLDRKLKILEIVKRSERILAIDVAAGEHKLRLIGVYLPYYNGRKSNEEFREQLSILRSLIETPERTVVVGDFNSDPSRQNPNDVYLQGYLRSNSLELVDKRTPQLFDHTFMSGAHKGWIDHVAGPKSNGLNMESVIIDEQGNLSDHLPISTTVEMVAVTTPEKENKQQRTITINWNNPRERLDFQHLATEALRRDKEVAELIHVANCRNHSRRDIASIQNSLNKVYEGIKRALSWATSKVIERKAALKCGARKSHMYWDDELAAQYKLMKQAYIAVRNTQCERMKVLHKQHRRAFRRLQRHKIREMEQRIAQERAKLQRYNPRRFWNDVNSKHDSPKPTGIALDDLVEAFKKIFCSQADSTIEPNIPDSAQRAWRRLDRGTLDSIFRNLANGKATGPDKISNEMLKHSYNYDTREIYRMFFETLVNTGAFPDSFTLGTIVPVIKKAGQSHSDVNNMRPITLSNSLANVYERIVLDHIDASYESQSTQMGFRKNGSTGHAFMLVKRAIQHHKEAHKKNIAHLAALDATQAFDKVNREKLFEKLRTVMDPVWRASLASYYNRTYVTVSNAGQTSNNFRTTNGVKQGGALSPRLFNIYVDALLEQLQKTQYGLKLGNSIVSAVLYADDVLLLADSQNKLKRLLNACEEYGRAHDITWNPTKSYVMLLNNGRSKYQIDMNFCGQRLQQADAIKYLGIELADTIKARTHVDTRIEKAYIAARLIRNRTTGSNLVSLPMKITLHKTLVRPILLYGLESWALTKSEVKRLESCDCNMVKDLVGLPRRTHSRMLLRACEMNLLRTEYKLMRLQFFERLHENQMAKNCLFLPSIDSEISDEIGALEMMFAYDESRRLRSAGFATTCERLKDSLRQNGDSLTNEEIDKAKELRELIHRKWSTTVELGIIRDKMFKIVKCF